MVTRILTLHIFVKYPGCCNNIIQNTASPIDCDTLHKALERTKSLVHKARSTKKTLL